MSDADLVKAAIAAGLLLAVVVRVAWLIRLIWRNR